MLVPSPVFYDNAWVSIDPGLSTCGIAIFKFCQSQLQSIDALTIHNNKISFESDYPVEYQSDRIIRMHKLCLAYRSILYQNSPILVCCESPFYNPRMPSAYGSLVETVTALRLETHRFNSYIPFVQYSPQEVKQSFKRSGHIGKLVMREALSQNNELLSKISTSIDVLDEHSIDAIAVGYTHLLSMLKGSLYV